MTNNMPPATGTTTSDAFAPDTLLTLTEITDLTGCDHTTTKNRRKAGRWPNAVQDVGGRKAWRVPVGDLVAAGDLDPSHIQHVENELSARRESRETKALREQVIRLDEQLAAAQLLADERAGTITPPRGLVRMGGAA